MGNLVAIVGRPNVGKSTLFNRLTKTRQAIVSDEAERRVTASMDIATGMGASSPSWILVVGLSIRMIFSKRKSANR